MSIAPPKRHYYVIEYVENTNRSQIRLAEIEEYESSFYLERELASRKQFEWYVHDPDDTDGDYGSREEDTLDEAAKYARSLAKEHNLEYIPFNTKDGILD